MYYRADSWALGASVCSPQWFDKFRYNSTNEVGAPRTLSFNLDLPLVTSVGVSYTGIDKWLFTTDLRYFNYGDVNGFGKRGFASDGTVLGIGFRNIFAVATGVQYQWSDNLTIRVGYSWNENPVPDSQSFVNTASPVVIQNMLTLGASWKVSPDFSLSVAYLHGFDNAITGAILSTGGAVPGTSVRNSAAVDSITLSGSIQFGAPRHSGVAQEYKSGSAETTDDLTTVHHN